MCLLVLICHLKCSSVKSLFQISAHFLLLIFLLLIFESTYVLWMQVFIDMCLQIFFS